MKPRVPMITAAVAAMTLAISGCSDNHETVTPTGPSAIGDAAEAPATSRTTASPNTAGVQVNDETSGTGDNWQNTGLNRSYTYIEGVPGTPRHVRVRPTGEKAGQSYEVEVSWEPPNWGATDAHDAEDGGRRRNNRQEHLNQESGWTSSWKASNHVADNGAVLLAAEGRAKVSLCNDVGCGPPWDAGSIVIGDAMEKPGPPEMTIESIEQELEIKLSTEGFRGKRLRSRPELAEHGFCPQGAAVEYWVRQARRRTTTKSRRQVCKDTQSGSTSVSDPHRRQLDGDRTPAQQPGMGPAGSPAAQRASGCRHKEARPASQRQLEQRSAQLGRAGRHGRPPNPEVRVLLCRGVPSGNRHTVPAERERPVLPARPGDTDTTEPGAGRNVDPGPQPQGCRRLRHSALKVLKLRM